MAQQTINLGATDDDGSGDNLKSGGDKINDNFTELYSLVTDVLHFKGNLDASTNPNYPSATKGDAYVITVAGKVGGASGKSVDVGDMVVAKADNAGGTEASVGTSWFVLEHNLAGALLAANNLSDVASASTARTNLGLVIGTDVEAHDADLTTIAGLSPSNDDILQRKSGAWANRTIAQLLTDLALVKGSDIPDNNFIRLDANYTLTNATGNQKLFDTTTNGRLTLTTGVYVWEVMLYVTSMDATSGNANFDVLGAGSATLAGQIMGSVGVDTSSPTSPAAQSGTWRTGGNAFSTSVVTAATGTNLTVRAFGVFKCTVAGTIVPSINLANAAAAVVNAGSFFRCDKLAALGTNSKGSWD